MSRIANSYYFSIHMFIKRNTLTRIYYYKTLHGCGMKFYRDTN